jgi:hypothetical protein
MVARRWRRNSIDSQYQGIFLNLILLSFLMNAALLVNELRLRSEGIFAPYEKIKLDNCSQNYQSVRIIPLTKCSTIISSTTSLFDRGKIQQNFSRAPNTRQTPGNTTDNTVLQQTVSNSRNVHTREEISFNVFAGIIREVNIKQDPLLLFRVSTFYIRRRNIA